MPYPMSIFASHVLSISVGHMLLRLSAPIIIVEASRVLK